MYWVIILGQFFATKLMDDDCYLNYVRGTNALSCCPPLHRQNFSALTQLCVAGHWTVDIQGLTIIFNLFS